jgi:peptide/nickel transport system permease protein
MSIYRLVRPARLVALLWIIITLNFIIPRLMPGDPLIPLLGQDVAALPHEELQRLRGELGLDRPLGQQYIAYLGALARGEWGYSFHYRQPVTNLIGKHLGWTLWMIGPAVILSTLLALTLGCLCGWRKGAAADILVTAGFIIQYSMPQFLTGMLLLIFLSNHLGWFPLGGLRSAGVLAGTPAALADTARHLVLPIATLTLASTPPKFMVMRNSVVAALEDPYVLYARAKGLSDRRVLFVHILKNASLPFISIVALHIGFLVSGALVVEVVFSINGMGSLIYEAALYRDYPLLQACFLILTLVVVTMNLLADLVSGMLDPRIRRGAQDPS